MKQIRIINISTILLVSFSATAILMASIMIFFHHQRVMNVLKVNLPGAYTRSFMLALYGIVGLAAGLSMIYIFIKNQRKGLSFLTLLWGFYAASRLMTILFNGSLNDFGRWLFIDSMLFMVSVVLLLMQPERKSATDLQESGNSSKLKAKEFNFRMLLS
ncbi:MAG TPA: DUF4345 family protein [Flavisolibacter sp.]|nr:DUF4345 family protein [Flavisolibacter sp.]